MKKQKPDSILIKLSNENRFRLGGQNQCGMGDDLKNGEYLIRCPKCKTFYHMDCWKEYGSKCPRLSYACWPEKILIIESKKIWNGLRTGTLFGGVVGMLIGLLVGTVGVAVRAGRPWTLAGFISGGVYSLLIILITLVANKKISFQIGLLFFLTSTAVIATYPKIGMLFCALFNLFCFTLIGLVLIQNWAINMRLVTRNIYLFLLIMIVIFSTWLSIIIASDGNLVVGCIYFGVTGLMLGSIIGMDSAFS